MTHPPSSSSIGSAVGCSVAVCLSSKCLDGNDGDARTLLPNNDASDNEERGGANANGGVDDDGGDGDLDCDVVDALPYR